MKDDNKDDQWQKDALEDDVTEDDLESGEAEAYEDSEDLAAEEDYDDQENNDTAVAGQAQQQDSQSEPQRWKWAFILSLIVIAALVITLIMNPFDSNKTLAKVNGTIIDKNQLYDKMYEQPSPQTGNTMGKVLLDQLVSDELVDQEMVKAKVNITDKEVEAFLNDVVKKPYPTEEQFQAALKGAGMTMEILNRNMLRELQFRKYFAPQIKVTDEEAKKYFDENAQQFVADPEKVQVSHILVNTQEEADAIIAELKTGADFATLAKEKSIEPAAKESGGDLGAPFAQVGSQFDQTFVDAAFTLQKGEISKAIKTQFGFHVIKVNDRIPPTNVTFEDKKEEIKNNLSSQKMSPLVPPWLDKLRTKAGFPAITPAPAPAQ